MWFSDMCQALASVFSTSHTIMMEERRRRRRRRNEKENNNKKEKEDRKKFRQEQFSKYTRHVLLRLTEVLKLSFLLLLSHN